MNSSENKGIAQRDRLKESVGTILPMWPLQLWGRFRIVCMSTLRMRESKK
jgi:hypothetical protein